MFYLKKSKFLKDFLQSENVTMTFVTPAKPHLGERETHARKEAGWIRKKKVVISTLMQIFFHRGRKKEKSFHNSLNIEHLTLISKHGLICLTNTWYPRFGEEAAESEESPLSSLPFVKGGQENFYQVPVEPWNQCLE